MLRTNRTAWLWCTRASVAAVGILAAIYVGTPWAACVALLPGIAFSLRHPVLADAPAMALALGSAVLWPVNPVASVVLAIVAGCVKESAPVWAAAYAFNPWALLGLIPVVVRWGMRCGEDPAGYGDALAHPIRSARSAHRGGWVDPMRMVAPWGGLLVCLLAIDVRLAVALALGYGQLLAATDEVRLYQWAAPVVALAAFSVVPAPWWPLLALSVVFNPWKGDGL